MYDRRTTASFCLGLSGMWCRELRGCPRMRTPSRFSYSAFALWESDAEEYFTKYLAETRAPRLPQEQPAAVGSCFDAFAKAALHEALFGAGSDPAYSLDALFEAQVEAHNRDWARAEGEYVFQCYKHSGAYDTLLGLLQQAIEPPRFEFTVEADILGVPFLGKPDCRFVLPGPVHVIHDFKVNGYCSKSAVSPTKGYMLCSDGEALAKPSKSDKQAHKQFVPLDYGGLVIDQGYMEDINEDWADQLSLYGWCLGEKIGDQNVVLSIHQIVGKPLPSRRPSLRVAEYRCRVRDSYQHHLAKRLTRAWGHITSGHVIPSLSREDNDNRCRLLETESVGLQTDGSTKDDFFAECVRPKYRG
jgi:hypothetical protein